MVAPKQSAFVSQIANYIQSGEERRELVKEVSKSCLALSEDQLPPLEYINTVGSDTYAHFLNAMVHPFAEFVDRFRLSPESVILDIGCGCGRQAIPFSKYLSGGKFYGIDVWKDGIDWCKEHVATQHGGFNFIHMEANNNYYFEDFDPEIQNNFLIPQIEDASLDFAYAISVFTHLTVHDSRAYLQEIARTLKDDGAAYLTTFIIDDFFFKYRARTKQHMAVKEFSEGCYHAYHGQDFFAGFTRRLWTQMCTEAGLRIISYELGKWAEKPGARSYQDSFVLIKAK